MHQSGALTPPETPKRSVFLSATDLAVIGEVQATPAQTAAKTTIIKDGILEFAVKDGTYTVFKDKRMGAGRFSQVFLAYGTSTAIPPSYDSMTPPTTPTSLKRRDSKLEGGPMVYAVKMAADKPSIKTLRTEARILTHLCANQNSREYVVPFHGFDIRQNAIVCTAFPATLAHVINNELEVSDIVARTTKLCHVLQYVARSLTSGLAWLHSMGVVHADIKPPNILLRPDIFTSVPLSDGQHMLDIPFTPVFADFTSSFLTTDDAMAASAGGGTYDYMGPELLSRPFPPPDFKADVYALAVSLLELISGQSPFQDAGANRNMKIAMIKEGSVLSWTRRNAVGKKRLSAAAQLMIQARSTNIIALLELALVKDPLERINAQQWSGLW